MGPFQIIEWPRKQLTELHDLMRSRGIRQDDFYILIEFRQRLPTGSARRRRLSQVGDDRDPNEVAFTRADRRSDG